MSHIRLIITLLIVMLWSNSALAEAKKFNPLVTYTCDSTADIIVITNSLLTPEEAKTYKFSDADGTYNPWKMAKLHLNAKVSALLKTNRTVNKCTLSSGEYTSTIEPKIFSRDTSTKCGQSISASVTIDFDGYEVLEKKAFEDYCHGNAPIITRITVFGKTSEVKIKRIPKYKFY